MNEALFQQRSYTPAGAAFQAPNGNFLTGAQVLTPGGFRPLSHEEKQHAAQIAAEAGFSLDGYQVVRREFFSHKFDPTLTIKENSITFNSACISKLDQVVYIQVLVNPSEQKLVIRPCSEGARDAVRWCIAKDDKRKSREISCGLFADKLHEMMGWEKMYRYKLQGCMITNNGEQLFLFDLTSTETYMPAQKEPGTRSKPAKPVYPPQWQEGFGMSVADHDQSIQIDLNEGFREMDMNQTVIDAETGEVIQA